MNDIRILMIESVGRCNSTCSYCPRGAGLLDDNSNQFISIETLQRALDLADPTLNRGIYLHHRGEPFLHPDLASVVRQVRTRGFNAYLSTNLISVTEQKVRTVLAAGLNELQMHFTAGLTRLDRDTLMARVHMVRKLNMQLRNNACKVEINYALKNQTQAEALEFLSGSPHFDETFAIYFYTPHDWPSLGKLNDRGIDFRQCNWWKERSCAILSNGDIVICCLDQWGHSKIANIWQINRIDLAHLIKRDICRGCVQHVEMDWLRRDAIEEPLWQKRRHQMDLWK